MWVFGYGSLIWNPGFQHRRVVQARLDHWTLRFWQASTDHRGTPEFPGRVATIIPRPGSFVWGHAYQLEGERDEILAYLDHREKGGYQRHFLQVETSEGESLEVLSYVGCQKLASFIGPEDEDTTADIIARAVGPSGANPDYLIKLHSSLREFPYLEPHVERLLHLVVQKKNF